MNKRLIISTLLLALLLVSTAFLYQRVSEEDRLTESLMTSETEIFWQNLIKLCGKAYSGVITRQDFQPSNVGLQMVMHVYDCSDSHVTVRTMSERNRDGVARDHTFNRHTDGRLELRHNYRNPDGTPANITRHGGFINNPGTKNKQIFPADQITTENMPSFRNWVWIPEIQPGERYVYTIHVLGTERVTRTEYDLTSTVAVPNN